MTLIMTKKGKIDYRATYDHTHARHVSYKARNWGLNYREHWQPTGVLRPDDTVLEVGCGNGKLCRRLANEGHDVTGLDVAIGDYDRTSYTFHQCDITRALWPTEPKVYDVAMAFDVFEHIHSDDIMLTLSNFVRYGRRHVISLAHCKSVGKLHVTIEDIDWWIERLEVFATGWKVVHTRIVESNGNSPSGTISVLVRNEVTK